MSNQEQALSLSLHGQNIPVLISSQLLRRYGCGQVDISFIDRGELYLIESKSSMVGVLQAQSKQLQRLRRSALFLESLLDTPVHLKFIAKR